jgi:hypothetical protein
VRLPFALRISKRRAAEHIPLTHNPKLDPQARAHGHRNQGIQELIELSPQQGVESQLRDPQALGRGSPREAGACYAKRSAEDYRRAIRR